MDAEVYLDIKNPLRIDSNGYDTSMSYFDTNAEEVYEKYISGYYDGIIIENSDKKEDNRVIYLVDDSKKIKSATDNIGTFDKTNKDIRYSVGKENQEADTKAKLDTAEKRIKALERINKSLRERMWLTPEGKADPGTLRRAAKHLMQEYGGSWSQKEMEAKL